MLISNNSYPIFDLEVSSDRAQQVLKHYQMKKYPTDDVYVPRTIKVYSKFHVVCFDVPIQENPMSKIKVSPEG